MIKFLFPHGIFWDEERREEDIPIDERLKRKPHETDADYRARIISHLTGEPNVYDATGVTFQKVLKQDEEVEELHSEEVEPDDEVVPEIDENPPDDDPNLMYSLHQFYSKHNPRRLKDVPLLIVKYSGKTKELISKLQNKYHTKVVMYQRPEGFGTTRMLIDEVMTYGVYVPPPPPAPPPPRKLVLRKHHNKRNMRILARKKRNKDRKRRRKAGEEDVSSDESSSDDDDDDDEEDEGVTEEEKSTRETKRIQEEEVPRISEREDESTDLGNSGSS